MGSVALSGTWRLTEFEAGGAYAGLGTTLVGAVPFAASQRQFSSVRLRLGKGVTTEGRLARVGSLVTRDRTLSSSGSVHFDRLIGGSLRLQFDHARARTQDDQETAVEWRGRRYGGIGVQFRQKYERRRQTEELTRRLQIELSGLRGAHGLRMGLSSSMRLDGRSGDPRAAVRIASSFAPGPLEVSAEAEVDALAAGSPVRLGRLVTRTEIPLGPRASVQVGHTYMPGDRVAIWRRIEMRIMHSFAL